MERTFRRFVSTLLETQAGVRDWVVGVILSKEPGMHESMVNDKTVLSDDVKREMLKLLKVQQEMLLKDLGVTHSGISAAKKILHSEADVNVGEIVAVLT